MAAAASKIPSIAFHDVTTIHRRGCACKMTPTYQVTSTPEGERTRMIHEYSTMMLVHQTKDGRIKNSLRLGPLHHELEIDSLVLSRSGASNILLSKVSFDCLIVDASGQEKRAYVHFDLRIPGTNAKGKTVLSSDMMAEMYGGKENLYAALKFFYQLGRSTANPSKHKHGHCPDYNPETSKHDQYILHTEQILAAYLALPKAAQMLFNRLTTEVRTLYPDASSIKIYNMGLHMHSTKTCCAPCEFVLVGLMQANKGLKLL